MDLPKYIDHTLLKADARTEQIDLLCKEAAEYQFAAVCVNPRYVRRCADILKSTDVKTATVVGFPLGANASSVKADETKKAVEDGAGEIDMVISVGDLLSGDVSSVAGDIGEVISAAGDLPVKVIIETCYLSNDQIRLVSKIACDEGAAFVKTSTGFGTRGASVEDVRIIKEVVGDRCLIKASGGIRDRKQAMAMIEAGASRIGTSSGIAIIKGE